MSSDEKRNGTTGHNDNKITETAAATTAITYHHTHSVSLFIKYFLLELGTVSGVRGSVSTLHRVFVLMCVSPTL